mmetsp:Transcript_24791/g.53469  ORF Transcript_24791/g.53469 Transcript_24791/m.53469 type:complete len:235 (-) Transcript_24791:1472-2176(-)
MPKKIVIYPAPQGRLLNAVPSPMLISIRRMRRSLCVMLVRRVGNVILRQSLHICLRRVRVWSLRGVRLLHQHLGPPSVNQLCPPHHCPPRANLLPLHKKSPLPKWPLIPRRGSVVWIGIGLSRIVTRRYHVLKETQSTALRTRHASHPLHAHYHPQSLPRLSHRACRRTIQLRPPPNHHGARNRSWIFCMDRVIVMIVVVLVKMAEMVPPAVAVGLINHHPLEEALATRIWHWQ